MPGQQIKMDMNMSPELRPNYKNIMPKPQFWMIPLCLLSLPTTLWISIITTTSSSLPLLGIGFAWIKNEELVTWPLCLSYANRLCFSVPWTLFKQAIPQKGWPHLRSHPQHTQNGMTWLFNIPLPQPPPCHYPIHFPCSLPSCSGYCLGSMFRGLTGMFSALFSC